VNKVLTASLILFSVVVAVLGPLRWITAEMTEIQERVFRSLGILLGILPLSAAVVALVAISRLMIDMGVTTRRLLGLGCASGAILAILGFLWLAALRPSVGFSF